MGEAVDMIQVTNIAPNASLEQMKTMFSLVGEIDDIVLYPDDDSNPTNQSKVCYIRFKNETSVSVAQHLTNTVFIDRAMIVQPHAASQIPDAVTALNQTSGIAFNGGSNSGLISQIVPGVGGTQVISTIDPRLSALGLPQYPPLPANTDPNRVEEIRRTIYVGNLDSKLAADMVLEFFNSIGEVKFVRMAGDENQPTRFAFIEFTEQSTVANALQYNGVTFGGRPLKINHSNNAIVKHPILKSLPLMHHPNDHHNSSAAGHHHSHHHHASHHKQETIDETMRRVREAQSQITAAIEQPSSGGGGKESAGDSSDRKRSRSRDRDREGRGSRDEGSSRDRRVRSRSPRDRQRAGGRRSSRDRSRERRSRASPSRRRSSRDRRVSPPPLLPARRERSPRSRSRERRSYRRRSSSRERDRTRTRDRKTTAAPLSPDRKDRSDRSDRGADRERERDRDRGSEKKSRKRSRSKSPVTGSGQIKSIKKEQQETSPGRAAESSREALTPNADEVPEGPALPPAEDSSPSPDEWQIKSEGPATPPHPVATAEVSSVSASGMAASSKQEPVIEYSRKKRSRSRERKRSGSKERHAGNNKRDRSRDRVKDGSNKSDRKKSSRRHHRDKEARGHEDENGDQVKA